MRINIKYSFICIAMLLGVAMLFSCENNIREIQRKKNQRFPIGETENFELIYTDSTRVKAILKSKKNFDFTNQKFPYMEFPEGLVVELFNNKQEKSIVEANYGIFYLKTSILELRDSVRLTTPEGKKLKTDQLFYYETDQWVFTEKPFTFIDSLQGSVTNGVGMDFDRNFTQLKAHKITGILPIKE